MLSITGQMGWGREVALEHMTLRRELGLHGPTLKLLAIACPQISARAHQVSWEGALAWGELGWHRTHSPHPLQLTSQLGDGLQQMRADLPPFCPHAISWARQNTFSAPFLIQAAHGRRRRPGFPFEPISPEREIPSVSTQSCPLGAGTLTLSRGGQGVRSISAVEADDLESALRKATGEHVGERGRYSPSLRQSRFRTQHGSFPVAQSTCEEERNPSASPCQCSDKM